MGTPQSNNLPPGFRFHPTDEELILHYLRKKVASIPLPVSIIAEVDIYKFNPWELPAKAAFGEKEWYFFSPRDRKYPNGARPNRAAASGYWKATGTDKNIVASLAVGERVQEHFGVKKALVFYKGRPPKGVKTNWIMHEYRLVDTNRPIRLKDTSMRLDDWVLCRIYKKSKHTTLSSTTEAATTIQVNEQHQEEEIEEKQMKDTTFLPISKSTTLVPPPHTTLMSQKSLSFSNLLDATDYSMLRTILSENHYSNNYPTPSEGLFNCENLDEENPQDFYNNNNNSYLFHKNPSFQNMENITRPKHQLSNIDHEDMMMMYPSKKYPSSSCNFPNTDLQNENPQWNFIFKQPLVNQQLFPGPQYLRFHE